MDFNSIADINIHVDSEGFIIFTSDYSYKLKGKDLKVLNQILDSMGELSSRAQGLKTTITTGSKFFTSDHKMYLKVVDDCVIGLLKIGVKQLFINDAIGKYKKITPLCVLDFYVHESQQRSGYGKQLFEKMLKVEKIRPHKIAYDRPSIKLISFLKKHYSLDKYVPQNNNFIVFDDYFEESVPISKFRDKKIEYDEFYSYDPKSRTQIKEVEETKTEISNYHTKVNYKNSNNITPDINRNKYIQDQNLKYTSAQTNKYDKKNFNERDNDSIDDLSSKFDKININNSKPLSKNNLEPKNYSKNSTKNCPWAVDDSSSSINSSSSSTYGSYYFKKNK